VKGRLLLNVVIGESATVLELFAGENQPLLIGWDSFLVLDLSLDVFDAVRWFDLQGDGLAGQGLNENLHSTAETQNQVKGRLFLDVVIGESTPIFQLFSSED